MALDNRDVPDPIPGESAPGPITWTELQAAPGGSRLSQSVRSSKRALITLFALALVVAAIGLAASSRRGDGGDQADGKIKNPAPTTEHQVPDKDDSQPNVGLISSGSPIDGKETRLLPVIATPQNGLHEGDAIDVVGRGFRPNEMTGVVLCSSEAYTKSLGVDACQLGPNYGLVKAYVTSDAEGTVRTTIVPDRYIEVPALGQVDCQSAPERCMVAIGAVSDYDRSGGAFLLFADSPRFPEISADATPTDDLAPGQSVLVSLDGGLAGRGVFISQCTGDRCAPGVFVKVGDDGRIATRIQVQPTIRDEQGDVDCNDSCVIHIQGEGIPEWSSAPYPESIPISFDLKAPPVTGPSSTTISVPPPTTQPDSPPSSTAPPVTSPPDSSPTTVGGSEPGDTPATTTPPPTDYTISPPV